MISECKFKFEKREYLDGYGWGCDVVDPSGDFIAVIGAQFFDKKAGEKLQNLIAAAPQTAAERDRLRETNAELLAELSALIDICKTNGVGDHRLPEATAAMEKAKAEGK
jgi:hypothetical protein